MKNFSLFSMSLFPIFLSSCGFLLSPVGEELVVDGAEEVIKIEQELTHKPTNTMTTKESIPQLTKEPIKQLSIK
jgi:hypothetical protein